MSASQSAPLDVVIRELPSLLVACLSCRIDTASGQFSDEIARSFRSVERLARRYNLTAAGERSSIGVPETVDGRLVGYECCVPVHGSGFFPPGAEGGLTTRTLSGGRYAVLTLRKDSRSIPGMIGRFFSEYAPAHGLVPDAARPTLERYSGQRMEFCVPIR